MADCKIVIKDPSLAKVLGTGEFETYADFDSALQPGDELLVADKQGHFIVKFRKFAFSPDGKLKILFDSPRGEARIDEFIGRADKVTLQENKDALDAAAKSRLIEAVPETTPTTPEEQSEPSAPKSVEAIYDSMDSKVKMEQFESTTGQDVKNEFEGTLDERPSTLPKMALRQAISENPQKYRLFVVADSPSYFNDEGIEPTGEVLLVVHAAAYESARAEKGAELSQQELSEVAVKMDGEKIVAEGSIYTLPLEGSLTGEAQFFERNHAERIEIYSDKYGVTPAQADAHFRAGEARMKDARQRARTAPVEVGLQSVSMGSYVNEPLSIDEFISNNKLTPIGFFKNTGKGKVLGRVYFQAKTPDGRTVEMLTVPKGVREMYGDQFLWDTYQNGTSPEFLSSLFGNFHRPKGPYLKGGVLHVNSRPIETFDEFVTALNQTDWPVLSNKVDSGLSTVFTNGEFQIVPNNEFLKMHVETDGNLWTHQGRPVPYPANRYLYLNITGSKVAERVTSSTQNLDRAAQDLFRDPREYDRIASSGEPKDVVIKMMLPQFFSKAFLKSQSYPRLRKRMRLGVKQQGSLAISYPVGGRYFGSKAVAKRKIADILANYISSGVSLPIPTDGNVLDNFEAYIQEKIQQAQEQGIELGTFESETNALYTHFSNAFVAEAEAGILFGNLSEVHGISAEISPSWWNAQTEETTIASQFTGLPQTPSPVLLAMTARGGVEVVAKKYFSAEAISKAKEAENNNEGILVNMPIDDFLSLNPKGDNADKRTTVSKLVKEGTKFDEIPFLNFTHDGNGNAEVTGHEGRHRAMELKTQGETHIPVLLRNRYGGQGEIMINKESISKPENFNEDLNPRAEKFPTKLRGHLEQKNVVVDFPLNAQTLSTLNSRLTTTQSPTNVPSSETTSDMSTADIIKVEASALGNARNTRKDLVLRHYQYDLKVDFFNEHGISQSAIDGQGFDALWTSGALTNSNDIGLDKIAPDRISDALSNPTPFIEAYKTINEKFSQGRGNIYKGGEQGIKELLSIIAQIPVTKGSVQTENYITYDAYRTLSKASGTWTEAQETEYQDHIADPNKKVGGGISASEISAQLAQEMDVMVQEVYEKYEGAEASKQLKELFASKKYRDVQDRYNELNPTGADLNGFVSTLSESDASEYRKYREIGYRLTALDRDTLYKPFTVTSAEKKEYERLRGKFAKLFVFYEESVNAKNGKNVAIALSGTKTVEFAYSGPMNTKLDGNSEVQSFEQINLPVRKFTVVGSDSEIGRQMLSEGYQIATPEGKTMLAPYFYSPREAAEEDSFLQELEQAPNSPVEKTPAYDYAINLLGKNFANKLFSSGQPYTFADIEAFRKDLGKSFSFTRFNARADFAITPRSEARIASGAKTITLRDSGAAYANRSGLVEIDGEVFDIQEVGNLTLRKALEATGMTQQEFAKAFLGEDTGIESIREESVKAFFNGEGTKRVFTIKKLGEPVDPRKRKSKKQMPC